MSYSIILEAGLHGLVSIPGQVWGWGGVLWVKRESGVFLITPGRGQWGHRAACSREHLSQKVAQVRRMPRKTARNWVTHQEEDGCGSQPWLQAGAGGLQPVLMPGPHPQSLWLNLSGYTHLRVFLKSLLVDSLGDQGLTNTRLKRDWGWEVGDVRGWSRVKGKWSQRLELRTQGGTWGGKFMESDCLLKFYSRGSSLDYLRTSPA